MIFKKETMAWNWPGWTASTRQALDLYNYLHQYDNRFTLDGNNTSVDFNGIFKIKILADHSRYRPHWAIQCSNASQTVYDTQPSPPSRQWWFEGGVTPLNVRFLETDNLIYFLAWPKDSSESSIKDNCIGFIYLRTLEGRHYAQTINPGTPEIDGRPYYNVATGAPTPFSFKPFINFSISGSNIFTADTCILESSVAGEIALLPDLRSCSTIARDKTITINGKNYYAPGTHVLVPLDIN